MKAKKLFFLFALPVLISGGFSSCSSLMVSSVSAQVRYVNPRWAPPYYEGVRYYYIPDIEVYFDLTRNEFIFLEDGRWYSSPYLPSYYGDFDLDDCFVIALNINVFRPWLHHHYYISHYPRYYYRDYYDHRNIPYVRGFNENSRRPFFWSENERNRARKWDNEGLKENRKFKYERFDNDIYNPGNRQDQGRRPSDNRQQPNNRPGNTNTQPQQPKQGGYDNRQQQGTRQDNNNVTQPQNNRNDNIYQPQQRQGDNSNRQQGGNTDRQQQQQQLQQQRKANVETQSPNYYGKRIGQPVKVERQMREPRSSQPATRSQSDQKSDNKDGSSGRGRR